MCVFMICIDPCAWQIGYKLGNILPGKWNTLDCRSTLGGVLNSHGQCDILFVGVRTSVIVCVFVWCNCNLQVVLGTLWKYFGPTIRQVTGYPCYEWGERMSLSLGESRVSCQAHGHTFHSLVCQPQNENICWWNLWQIKFPSGLNLDHVLFQEHQSHHHKNKQTNQRNPSKITQNHLKNFLV